MADSDHNQVVLVGGGHAHLALIRDAEHFHARGVELTLIDPGSFWYSGLATGMLGGQYERHDDVVDLAALSVRYGVRFMRDRAVGLDTSENQVRLASGAAVGFDALSFNIGSVIRADLIAEGGDRAVPVKPISMLWRLRERIEQWPRGRELRLVVVGAGPTGCEIACNLRALLRRTGREGEITLISARSAVLPESSARARRLMAGALEELTIGVLRDRKIARITADGVIDDAGQQVAADFVILATGLRPPLWLDQLGLPLGKTGGLYVDRRLRSVGHNRVFGAGDCIDFQGRGLPRVGVYGVRQARTLRHNLIARIHGESLRTFHPQSRYLSILNLGDDRALATWDGLAHRSRAMMRLKHRLDRRFIKKFQIAES